MKALKNLLDDLENVSREHIELYDTDVRERMFEVVDSGFLNQTQGYKIPSDLGMFKDESNALVRAALERFIAVAVPEAKGLGLSTSEQRLNAFENPDITSIGGKTYDDFFGSS